MAGLLAAALAGLLALTGCGSSTQVDLLQQIKDSGQLSIGTSNDPPWSAVTNGQATGIIPDLLREFLRREGINAKIVSTPMPFDSLIPSLNTKRIDLIGDAMYATPARAQQVAFTDILFYNTAALVVLKGNPLGLTKLEDLCGRVGATYKGTTYIDDLNAASAKCPPGQPITVKTYDTAYQVMQDVSTGRVNGGFLDSSLASLAISQNPSLAIEMSAGYQPPNKAASDNALAVRKGNDAFLAEFNRVYGQMKADGTAKAIFEKNGLAPSDSWLNL
jgi:polar amino acid transport system substrate-binding protein